MSTGVLVPWSVSCGDCSVSGCLWTHFSIWANPTSSDFSLDSVVISEFTVSESDGLRSIDCGVLELEIPIGEFGSSSVFSLVVLTETSSAKLK